MQSKSWFLDQVLHPYESQHTLEEVYSIFEQENVELVATSINKYEIIDNIQDVFEMEKGLYNRGIEMLEQHKYFPGFFYVLGQKR